MLPMTQIDTFYNGLTLGHCDTINAAADGTFMKRRPEECYDLIKNKAAHHNDWDTSAQRNESSSSITSSFDPAIIALKAEMAEINRNLMKVLQINQQVKVVTPRCETYGGPHSYNDCPTTIGQTQNVYATGAYNLSVEAPVSALKPNPKPSIPYPSRLNDQNLHDKANNQMEKFFQIFHDLNFNISFTDALILMPKFASTIKSLLTNKEKLFELARTPLNDHRSTVLKNLIEKLGDAGKFLIPCDFLGMDECLALIDLGICVNLMPLSIWNKLSLPDLSPTCMTLELADRSISRPVGVAEDVSIKVDWRALINVYEGELTLRVGNKAVTFNLDQTSRYSANYDAESINQIDVINVACEEYSQEVLGFSMSGNPTPSTEPIVSTFSPTRTPFEDSDFLLEETDAFLAIKDEPISLEIDYSYYDLEGDILLLEEYLNDDPSSTPFPPQELKVIKPKNEKSSIDEPFVVELKDLPPHLEYEFLEGDDKLPVIIANDLKYEEKTDLIKVLKSHMQALAWQLSNIKGINLEFYTHKILMEDDFKLEVKHQRRVNLKIHEVTKKEVFKLLDAGLIYPILDSPWVSPVHCVPKKGGFTVVENEENELIPTRLVTG
uniref:Reverse transcriptase domain-containing protein n=1 Tax=Tanacetum cinerariifolium TaxID=118510 RepID=A0A699HD41_TANCI|nr:reverse transcriptase domain-containing protein [Tanacetum cinerariifolium]